MATNTAKKTPAISKAIEHPLINPYLAVVLGVIAVSFASIFIRLSSAPPLVIAFYRLFFTFLILTPLALRNGARAELGRMTARDLLLAACSGVFLALHFAVWITSLSYTSVASSTVLVTMQPLFVVAGGYLFLQERIGRSALFGAALALAGSALIGISDFRIGGLALWGDILAFSGAAFVAGYVLIGRNLRNHLSVTTYTFLVYGVASVCLLVFNLLGGQRLYPYPAADWVWFLALAVVPTIMGHNVFNWALRYVKAAVVSVSVLGEPVGASVLACLIFHEMPTVLQLAGGSLILTGLYLFLLSARRHG